MSSYMNQALKTQQVGGGTKLSKPLSLLGSLQFTKGRCALRERTNVVVATAKIRDLETGLVSGMFQSNIFRDSGD